jgi:glycosyltransferase involved in cell wall biosynthesis
MKLLLIFPSATRGGVEEYNLTVGSAAARQGWDVHAAFPRTSGTASLIEDFTQNGVHYHPIAIAETEHQPDSLGRHFLRFIRVLTLLLWLRPDVVQVTLPYPIYALAVILACGLLKIPTVVRFGLVPDRIWFSDKRIKAYAWARARNQQWITISENNRKLVCESFQIPEHEILCIYNGSKASSSATASNPEQDEILRQQTRQALGLSDTDQALITVGRLDPQKGYIDLIPAIPHIIKEFPAAKFIWVGDGEQRDELTRLVEDYGIQQHVLFLGYRSDVPLLLKSADLFVFPTHFEGGQSFAIAEAMAYGLPIVTSNASGIPEVIRDRTDGLLFRSGDSCDLLETLRWALRHPEKMREMAESAKQRAQDFTEEKMISKYLEVWKRLSRTIPTV